jgi:hypothetical protein
MIQAMTAPGPWSAMTQLLRLVGVVIALGWAGFLVWNGWDLLSTEDPDAQRGGFSMVAFGGLLLMIALVSFVYHALKARAPALQRDRPTEPEDVTFDAEVSLERYLARKAEQERAQAVTAEARPAPPASPRPVFGRRGTTA